MPIILISGGKRTGTTLLQNVVCSYEGTTPALSEAQLITRLMQALRWAEDTENFDAFVTHTFPDKVDLIGYFSGMLSQYARQTRKVYGCEGAAVFKNPEYCTVLDELLQVAPTAKFIFSVRDPRDQVVSELEVVERKRQLRGETRLAAGNRDAAGLARTLNRYYDRVLELNAEMPGRFLFVRYEDLVLDFASTRSRLDAYTGLSGNCFDPGAEWPRYVSDGEDVPGYPTYSRLYGKPVEASSIGRYRQSLGDDEIAQIETICAPLMQCFGYEATARAEPAASACSRADEEARLFLANAGYSTDTPPNELKALLARTNALKSQPECSEAMQKCLEMFRRATRGALDLVEFRQGSGG